VKLIFINRFFHPDYSATSQMLSDVAFELGERGQAVAVITRRQLYDAPAAVLSPTERIGNVDIHRVRTSRFGRANLIGRTIDYASFYISAAWRLWRLARVGDCVIAKTDPPMISAVAVPVCRLRRAHLVNWLQDLFPETAEVLGVGGRIARSGILRGLRDHSLRAARMNIVLSELMAIKVVSLGVATDRIRVIANWADGTLIRPLDPAENPLRSQWGLTGKFVVGYSGNLGRAHDIDTLIAAIGVIETAQASSGPANLSQVHLPICWLFIGGGALFDRLEAEIARRRYTSVIFKPYQARPHLAESLSAADVHLVSLRPELEGLIVPSKIYGILAAGRAAIFIGDQDGEIARLIRQHDCGRTVTQGDGPGLASTVLNLSNDLRHCREIGMRARTAFDAHCDKKIAIGRWERLLLEVCGCRHYQQPVDGQ
jgi:colanic acid biosynthesis glycosyl transferase WcaI